MDVDKSCSTRTRPNDWRERPDDMIATLTLRNPSPAPGDRAVCHVEGAIVGDDNRRRELKSANDGGARAVGRDTNQLPWTCEQHRPVANGSTYSVPIAPWCRHR